MDLLKDLTAAQREAVTHGEGPLLVLAGPGSGKTRVITRRVAYLIAQGVRPRQVLAITFTNKAADEMRSRVEDMAPGSPVWISTFHRFCARMLRHYAEAVGLQPNYTIYDTADRLRAIKAVLAELELDSTHYHPERIEATLSRAKNDLIGPEEYERRAGDHLSRIVAKVYRRYQERLREANAADFDDLLFHFFRLLHENPEIRAELDDRFQYVLVDEYQDTNSAQYAIVRALSIDHPNLCATGDPDQSIYSWRGANLNNILEFERDFPQCKVVRLEQNYRSTKSILRVADHLIRFNRRRKHKDLYTDNGEGRTVRVRCYESQLEEARAIAQHMAEEVASRQRNWSDFAVFYRVNALSRGLELAFRQHNIPYQVVSGLEFYQRKEIKDILAYLKLIHNPRDNVSLLRVINTPPRNIGKTTVARLSEAARRQRLTLLEVCRQVGTLGGFSARQIAAVSKFAALIDRLVHHPHRPVAEIVRAVIEQSGYRAALVASSDPQDEERLANIEELLTAAAQYDHDHPEDGSLEGFLEDVSLVSDADEWDEAAPKVTLMTLHAAKGLEFPVVFIVALEENLLPHERSRDDPAQLEEERRLLFVGITRAQQELYLSRARFREFRGMTLMTIPSQFLAELPAEGVDGEEGEPSLLSSGLGSDDRSPWAPPKSDASSPSEEVGASQRSPHNRSGDGATIEQTRKDRQAPSRRRWPSTRLTTAAAMAGQPTPAPEQFREGMLVTHPEYGLGRVVALSGSDQHRKATVDFQTAGRRKFILSRAPLHPVKSC